MRTLCALALLALVATPSAAELPIFAGDPVNPDTGRAWPMLPGLPLFMPEPGEVDYDPFLVDTTTIGDVDLVVRAGTFAPAPLMPPPVAVPPLGVVGGDALALGADVPFTVLVSNGGPGLGAPLVDPQMNGLPVVVLAFADLDGDGWIGPTNADAAGASDNGRERQESDFPVGRQVAVFDDGAAHGSVAVGSGAPASTGGLTIVLGALAYVGPFRAAFFEGNVPDGPGVATALPFWPRLAPDRVVDGEGRGGPADPDERLGFELEPDFDPPVDHAVLGTPFALPTDGSSATIDRARVVSAAYTRPRFVRPSLPVPMPADGEIAPTPILRGAGGTLFEPLDGPLTLADDGAGNGLALSLIPVDRFDTPTDPPAGTTVTLLASPTLRIVAPDGDGDPAREVLALGGAEAIEIELDDAGGLGDSGGPATLARLADRYPVASLAVNVPVDAPIVLAAVLARDPAAFVAGCRLKTTLVAVVDDAPASMPVASISVDGTLLRHLHLRRATPPPGVVLPPGAVFAADVALPRSLLAPATVTLAVAATGNGGSVGAPRSLVRPLVASSTPLVVDVDVTPTSVTAGTRAPVTVRAQLADDCGVRRALVEIDTGSGFRRAGRLRDRGRGDDVTAGDGTFSGTIRLPVMAPGTVTLRVVAENGVGVSVTSAPLAVQALAP